MSKAQLQNHFRWFVKILPERIAALQRAVNGTPGFEDWKADASIPAIKVLGEWFAEQVKTRMRSQIEIDRIKKQLKFPVEVSEHDLSDETYLFATDIGMCIGNALIAQFPQFLEWYQDLSDARNADYGHPIVTGFGQMALNPVRIAVVFARGIASRSVGPEQFAEVFDYWRNLAITAASSQERSV